MTSAPGDRTRDVHRTRSVCDDAVSIRRVDSLDGIRVTEALQARIWSFDPIDILPGRFMAVVCRSGGMLLGAFDGDRMIGFAFSYPGWREQRAIHCSHMLAVLPEYAGRRVGFRLKQEQRRRVLAMGLDHMTWTFDPLESRNAFLNLQRLGVEVWEYWPNLYGRTSSELHAGIDTDRFVARWQLDGARALARARGESDSPDIHEVLDESRWGRVNNVRVRTGFLICDEPRLRLRRPKLVVEIPVSTAAMRRQRPRLARSWQERTRRAFTSYFRRGYRVVDFVSGAVDGQHRSFYLLEKKVSRARVAGDTSEAK